MERELLLRVTKKDLTETAIRGSGPGGQHRNKSSTGIRLVHKASGARGEATDSKSQHRNRMAAWARLRETPEWKAWYRTALAEAYGRPSIASIVEAGMAEKNITTQVLDEKQRWVTVDPATLT